ncbi:MAG: winged helix-turn-helix domain-containing protein [Clostridia bacterium]|nr:winged helix-turn-helix domain-containing protein [Clostridia bacterium]
MEKQIVICSHDAVFARMLELEFSFHGCTVQTVQGYPEDLFAEVVLLDLDSAAAPPPECYRRMIGFTRGKALSEDQTRRQCSMILHRPFEMPLLRREVLGEFEKQKEKSGGAVQLTALKNGKLELCGVVPELTPHEQAILSCLLEHRGEVVSRDGLAELIGESAANKVDVYICYLRRKIAKITPVKLIATVRNRGYRLDF